MNFETKEALEWASRRKGRSKRVFFSPSSSRPPLHGLKMTAPHQYGSIPSHALAETPDYITNGLLGRTPPNFQANEKKKQRRVWNGPSTLRYTAARSRRSSTVSLLAFARKRQNKLTHSTAIGSREQSEGTLRDWPTG